MKTARSAIERATLTDCSTTTIVSPAAFNCSMVSSNWTTSGASPRESSSISNTFGSSISDIASPSICCSPPDRVPAGCSIRSARIGKSETTRSVAAATRRESAQRGRCRRSGSRGPKGRGILTFRPAPERCRARLGCEAR